MDNNDEVEHDERDDYNIRAALGFLAGILLGGLAGAGTMLLKAPQSGKRTRAQIRHKGRELRDQASTSLDQAMTDARTSGRNLTTRAQHQAEQIQQRGQDLLDEQKERWSPVIEAGQKAAQGKG